MFDLLGQVDELATYTCTPVNTSNLVMDAFVDILYIISQMSSNKAILATMNIHLLIILIYNSVLKCQHTILKSGASTPRTVTKFAVKTATDLASTI